jgi:O-antigen/teichoic acid export membrane protein
MTEDRGHALDRETLTIARGAGVVFFGTLVGSVLRYLFQIAIARTLGPDSFGVFSLGFTLFRWISIIAELGLLSGVVRYVALFRAGEDAERVKGTIILALRLVFLSSTGLALMLFLVAGPIARGLFHEPDLAGVLRWFALAIPFTTPATVMLFAIQGFKIMEYTIVVKEIVSPLGRLVLLLVLFLLGGQLHGAVATYALVALLATGLGYRYLTKTFPPLSKGALRPVYAPKEILTFSYPILLVQVLTFANLWMDSTFLGYFRTSQEVGIYSAAQRTAFLSTLIMQSFNAIFSPVISGLWAEERYEMDLYRQPPHLSGRAALCRAAHGHLWLRVCPGGDQPTDPQRGLAPHVCHGPCQPDDRDVRPIEAQSRQCSVCVYPARGTESAPGSTARHRGGRVGCRSLH